MLALEEVVGAYDDADLLLLPPAMQIVGTADPALQNTDGELVALVEVEGHGDCSVKSVGV
jgi:hypothetical protein